MVILFFLIGILFLIRISVTSGPVQKSCEKQHKWVLRFNNVDNDDKLGYLVCKVCGKIPGND